jgi:hypothetical protein
MPKKVVLVLFLGGALILPIFGQTAGEISGLVTDSTGAVLVGATITVTNPQTNFARDATSNNTGNDMRQLQFSLKLVF